MKRIYIGRPLSVLLALALACAAMCMGASTLAEVETQGYAVQYDLDGDGNPETLVLYRAWGWDLFGNEGVSVRLAAYAADGSQIADGWVYGYDEVDFCVPTITLRLFSLGGGVLYAEGRWSHEGIETMYEVVEAKDGGLTQRLFYRDPGYSDGIGLENIMPEPGQYYDVVFYDEMSMDYATLIAPLNGLFADYGLTYVVRDTSAEADLSPAQLICDVDVMALPWEGAASLEASFASAEAGAAAHSAAPAYAYTTGDVNLRSGPGLGYDSVGVIPAGTSVEYLGEVSTDERGVEWYHISSSGKTGWGSSKYVAID